jgi:chemotaxis protein histidine kinase CheA
MSDAPKKAAEAAPTKTETPKTETPKAETPAAKTEAAPKPAAAKAAAKPAAKRAAPAKKAAPAAKKPAARKTAPKPAAKSAAPAKKAAPAASKPRAAAGARTPKDGIPAAIELSGEIGDTISRFMQTRLNDNMAFVADLQKADGPVAVVKAQQEYFDAAARAYSDHLKVIGDRYQALMTVSLDPVMGGMKEAGDQWRRMVGL